jgi:hypothetical protein
MAKKTRRPLQERLSVWMIAREIEKYNGVKSVFIQNKNSILVYYLW